MEARSMWDWSIPEIVRDMTSKVHEIRQIEIRTALLQAKVALQISEAQAATEEALVVATDGLKTATDRLGKITVIGALILSAATIISAIIAVSG